MLRRAVHDPRMLTPELLYISTARLRAFVVPPRPPTASYGTALEKRRWTSA